MRIAMLGVKGLPHPGGIETVVEELGARLVQRGHRVTVFVRPHFTPRSNVTCRGMSLVHLPALRSKYFDAITHTFLATLAAIWAGVDIAHIHSCALSIYAPLLRLRRIPTVVQSHGLDWQRAKWGSVAKGYLGAADYMGVWLPNATTVVSRKLERHFVSVYRKPVRYIPNGVNQVEALAPNEITRWGLGKRNYVLFAARLVPEKGCHILLDAFDKLSSCGLKLVIAGDSNYGDSYALNLRKRTRENVLFLGFVRGTVLAELMSNAYVFVQPSFIEGLSTGLLEAMSYGNCVVVSDIEENLEAIGSAGLSFKTGQSDDLAQLLNSLLVDEQTVEEMRRQAQQRVRATYNWDEIADQYENLYLSLARTSAG